MSPLHPTAALGLRSWAVPGNGIGAVLGPRNFRRGRWRRLTKALNQASRGIHPGSGPGNDTRMASWVGSSTPTAILVVVLDQAQTVIVGIIVKNDEQAAQTTSLVFTDCLEDHDQVLIRQLTRQTSDSLDEGQGLRPRMG